MPARKRQPQGSRKAVSGGPYHWHVCLPLSKSRKHRWPLMTCSMELESQHDVVGSAPAAQHAQHTCIPQHAQRAQQRTSSRLFFSTSNALHPATLLPSPSTVQ